MNNNYTNQFNPILKQNELEHIRKYNIKKSNIKNAGLGCFSRIYIKNGDLLDEYYGILISPNTIPIKNLDRSWCISQDLLLDGSNLLYYRNPMMYINGCSKIEDFKLRNVDVYTQDNSVFYFATSDIYPGDELIVDYGKQYFTSRGLPYEN